MKILIIAKGFLPYMFSENLVNGKLALAMLEEGWEIDVISSKEEGESYSAIWKEPFSVLKPFTHEVVVKKTSKVTRILDYIASLFSMSFYPIPGIRWGVRALKKAHQLNQNKKYDVIISRSPDDLSHLVAYQFAKKTNTPWIANWNDPAFSIWPEPYKEKQTLLNKSLYDHFIKKMFSRASINTFPSDNLRQHFIKELSLNDGEINTEVIPHIGLVNKYLPVAGLTEDKGDIVRICHAGNLSKERNPEILFQAIKEINETQITKIQLDIMGFVNDYTEDLIKKYKLEASVKFIGSFDFFDALSIMRQYDFLLLVEAPLDNGIFFPSKIVDYVQSNVPILGFSPPFGFINDLLSYHKAGILLNNLDYDKTLEGLLNIIKIKNDGNIKSLFSNQSLENEFSSSNVIQIYKNIFSILKIYNTEK